jgi:hypothetical protein
MNSDLIDNINKKDAYLEKHVFYGLKDLNDGFDYRNNQYFSERDFEVVLERVKSLGFGIYGIDTFEFIEDKRYYSCDVFEIHTSNPADATWYMTCFEKNKKRGDNIVYAASYFIPKKLYSE